MLLWLLFAGMTAAVLAVVLRPAFAPVPAAAAPDAASLAVFKDQLTDLDAQLARGQIDAADYDSLRTEVARRILRLKQPSAPPASSATSAKSVALVAAVVVPLASIALYATLGAPGVPDRPVAANEKRLANATAAELVAKVEARLAEHPEDGRGWDAIAPVYFRMQRYDEAADAYQKASRLLGETAPRLAGFAEATVLAHDGIVGDIARAAYEKLRVMEPDRFEPRFWLALADEQDGQRERAANAYRKLLADAPADAQWREMVQERLAAVTSTSRGPTAADVKASAQMPAADRAAMIESMVEGLAARLKTNGRDVDGWEKLITSYATLNKRDKAKTAVSEARVALVGDPQALSRIDALARRLEVQP